MRAVRFDHFGSPASLLLQEFPTPTLNQDEVLIEIHAAAVNPSDVKNVTGSMKHTTLPRTPGRDFAGIVVAGEESLIGTEVWGTGGDLGFTRDGSHAEYIVLPKSAVSQKPKTLTMEQAGLVGVTYVTASLCLLAAQLQAGETVLVIGGTGGVGSAAVQIAKWKGAQVISTVRRETDRKIAEENGADVVVDLAQEDLRSAVHAATGNQGANIIIDTVGGSMVKTCLESLAPQGCLVEISAPVKEPEVSFNLLDFYRRQLRLFGVNSLESDVTACASILTELAPGFETQKLHPPTDITTYQLEDVVKAYEQVSNRSATSKAVLTPKKI